MLQLSLMAPGLNIDTWSNLMARFNLTSYHKLTQLAGIAYPDAVAMTNNDAVSASFHSWQN